MSTTTTILILLAFFNFSSGAQAQSWSLLATSTDNNAIAADDEAYSGPRCLDSSAPVVS
jgi:hypothetical protein